MSAFYQLLHLDSGCELIAKLTPLLETLLDSEISLGLESVSSVLLAVDSINEHCLVVILKFVPTENVDLVILLAINCLEVFVYLLVS